ncbi:hypothetical protein HSE3_gp109 [Bacillus phage vB_BceM-HSE3]|nr:hypothetical protein HSE3_gp109 [Bacillus phage vB_BceM-HSE3]
MDESNLLIHVVIQDVVPVSTNEMYIPVARGKGWGGKVRTSLLASDKLREFKRATYHRLNDNLVQDELGWVRDLMHKVKHGMIVDLTITIPKDVFGNFKTKTPKSYDTSNMIKSPEDSILEFFNVNDVYTQEVRCRKLYTEHDKWQIEFKVYLTDMWKEGNIYGEESYYVRNPNE